MTYRLTSSPLIRPDEGKEIPPKKVFFISCEGNRTENEYLEGLERFKHQVGFSSLIRIEPLYRKDTNSAPKYVLELLEEYLEIRGCSIEQLLSTLPEGIRNKYAAGVLEKYINNPETEELTPYIRKAIEIDLKFFGRDLAYQKYIRQFDNELDEFCLMIDRDEGSNTLDEMKRIITECNDKGYSLFLSNPCFEFWLLLHLCDLSGLCKVEDLQPFTNVNVQGKVHELAGHWKSDIHFEKNYLSHIDKAIAQAKLYCTKPEDLIYNSGTNIFKLIEELRQTPGNK